MKVHSIFNRTTLRYTFVIIALALASIAGVYSINQNSHADAVKATDFQDGNIISDYVFYNKDSMNVQQIQSFLDGLIPTCLTWNNTTFVDGSGTRVGPPFVCLNNYYENPSTGETSFEKGGGAFAGGISAAQIIYNAAQTYGINPQVLLVMIKKESLGPLTSDNWPTKYQYKYAMGYACPDSGANNSANCDAAQGGFYKQVNLAAWQFKYYKDHPNDYRYALGWNSIQYSPDTTCGTKQVYIENIATLSLYIYTPYVPNAASLANYPGTATCGSYGNRNFFMFFSEWFGSTQKDIFSNMDVGRKLVAKSTVSKINPITGSAVPGQTISSGQVVKYTSKAYTLADNKLCLRTESNTSTGEMMCVLYDDLQEGPSFSTIPSVTLIATEDTSKIDPIDNSALADQTISKGQIVEYTSQATTRLDNKTCLRTKANTSSGLIACVPSEKLSEVPSFSSISSPRFLVAKNTVQKIDPYSETPIADQTIYKGMLVEYSSHINTFLSGQECLRTVSNTLTNWNMCVPSSNLKEYVNPNFTSMDVPRALKTSKATIKIDPITGEQVENLPADLRIDFSQKTYFNGNLCLRTATDTSLNKQTCVLYSNLVEL